jgi:hypothetical protein
VLATGIDVVAIMLMAAGVGVTTDMLLSSTSHTISDAHVDAITSAFVLMYASFEI